MSDWVKFAGIVNYNSDDIERLVQESAFGFIYKITNLKTGRFYIGQKQFYSYKKGKKHKPSDWKNYWGSSEELQSDLKKYGKQNFSREMLRFSKTRTEHNYYELLEQIKYKVLEKGTNSYNGLIRVRIKKPKDGIEV